MLWQADLERVEAEYVCDFTIEIVLLDTSDVTAQRGEKPVGEARIPFQDLPFPLRESAGEYSVTARTKAAPSVDPTATVSSDY